ncbi:MAG: hypothetical protein GY898_04085 [Proteobacteria bacterium]|nr:hypothetical protein [Pseudomonadota bacterium]
MSVYEDLSRLLDGELDGDAADALRARIAAEPELEAAWLAMQALPAHLMALPEVEPPPELNDAVLAGRDHQPALRRITRRWSRPAAVAAAMALVWLWTRPGPAAVLVSGSQFVDGQATLQAAHVEVEVNGRALIEVEPPEGVLREPGQEVEDMNRTHLLSALAGAAVTVTVYQGAAVVRADEGPPVTVAAGDVHVVGTPTAAAPPAAPEQPQRVSIRLDGNASPAEREAMLAAEIGRLRDELTRAEMSSDIARGQLASHEGEPIAWPEDLDDVYRPEGFEANIEAALAEVPFGEIEVLDCSEYPCFAVIRSAETGDGWQDPVREFADLLKARAGDNTGVMKHLSGIGRDGEELRYAGISYGPNEDGNDEADVLQRTGFRINSVIEGLAEEAMPERQTEDVDTD